MGCHQNLPPDLYAVSKCLAACGRSLHRQVQHDSACSLADMHMHRHLIAMQDAEKVQTFFELLDWPLPDRRRPDTYSSKALKLTYCNVQGSNAPFSAADSLPHNQDAFQVVPVLLMHVLQQTCASKMLPL